MSKPTDTLGYTPPVPVAEQDWGLIRSALDHLDEGISVFDVYLRLVACNQRFLELLDFPAELGRPGTHFSELIRYNAERGEYGPGDVNAQVDERCRLAATFQPHAFERTRPDGTVLEIRGNPIPEGGFVTIYADITQRKRAESALQQNRAQLETLNRELSQTVQQLQADEVAGRTIQFQLLPGEPRSFDHYTVSARVYPSTYLSGDFVDYFPIGDHCCGFYIADVAGHGIASAVVTVMLKTLMGQYREAYLDEHDATILSPERTLSRLDRDLQRQNVEKHLTMFYGVIDQRDNSMICSSGGQFPYPILHDGQQATSLECPSRPVGLFRDSRFQRRFLSLPEKFLLLLVSDGVLELLPQASLKEKHEALRGRLTGTDVGIDDLTRSLGLTDNRLLPDDVAFLLVTRAGGASDYPALPAGRGGAGLG